MKLKKLSIENIHGKLTRAEMKKIMAGSGTCDCNSASDCTDASKPRCVNACGGPVNGKWGICAA